MYKDRAVSQTITNKCCTVILAGAALGLLPYATAVAQVPGEELAPIPKNRPSVESYSLPPGPDNPSDNNGLQGPVDPDIPLARPTAPPAPARTPTPVPAPENSRPVAIPAPISRPGGEVQQPEREPRAESTEAPSAPAPDLAPLTADEGQRPVDPPADAALPSPRTAAEPAPESASNDWLLLSFGALLLVLLGATFFWRARRTKPPAVEPLLSERTKSPSIDPIPPVTEPIQPGPTIALDFRPHAANATLINAVLSFELTLSNQGGDALTGIKVNGAMVQAENEGGADPGSIDLSPLHEVEKLVAGKDEKILTEFRVPLASIRPIVFRSQALFVPLVHISIEYTDGSGFQHFQSATYLVGTEHQPPRPKMAPLRLDLGPRRFTPLGYRALTVA